MHNTRKLGWLVTAGLLGAALVAPNAAFAVSVDWATVTGYAEGTSHNNHADTWGPDCTKLDEPGGSTHLLGKSYGLVIVKAGSDQSTAHTNTLFADASAGQTVWADSNGSGAFDKGDKTISHIIFCDPQKEESASVPVESASIPVEFGEHSRRERVGPGRVREHSRRERVGPGRVREHPRRIRRASRSSPRASRSRRPPSRLRAQASRPTRRAPSTPRPAPPRSRRRPRTSSAATRAARPARAGNCSWSRSPRSWRLPSSRPRRPARLAASRGTSRWQDGFSNQQRGGLGQLPQPSSNSPCRRRASDERRVRRRRADRGSVVRLAVRTGYGRPSTSR